MSGFTPSAYQAEIFKWVEGGTGNAFIDAAAGAGKCLGVDTPVLRFDGTVVAVQDVVPGDLLMGPDSRPRCVLSISTGYGLLYRITPIKGMPWVCNAGHIMTLMGSNRHLGEIRDI